MREYMQAKVLICFFVLFGFSPLAAWEAEDAIDPIGDLFFTGEHLSLAEEITSKLKMSPGCSSVLDYNSEEIDFKLLQKRSYCPIQFAELPDFSFSMEDFIGQNKTCPPIIAWDAKSCHQFIGLMGAFNSNHFPPQTKTMYTRYHKIALEVAKLGKELKDKLTGGFEEFPKECKMEALLYESIGQHFVQDTWSVGHMWERWGGPEAEDFDISGGKTLLNQIRLKFALYIGAISGAIHGWKAVTQKYLPVLPQKIQDDPMSGPHKLVKWKYIGDAPEFEGHPGIGDLFLDQFWNDNEYSLQKNTFVKCAEDGYKEVLSALGEGSAGDSPLVDKCWNSRATNRAMQVGLRMRPGIISRIIMRAIFRNEDAENNFVIDKLSRVSLSKLSAVILHGATKHPNLTYLAQGYAEKDPAQGPLNLYRIGPNGVYNKLPSYTDPTQFPHPSGVLIGEKQVKYFNQCHTKYYCENQAELTSYKNSCRSDNIGNSIDCEICEDLARRFVSDETPICNIITNSSSSAGLPGTPDEIPSWCRGQEKKDYCCCESFSSSNCSFCDDDRTSAGGQAFFCIKSESIGSVLFYDSCAANIENGNTTNAICPKIQ